MFENLITKTMNIEDCSEIEAVGFACKHSQALHKMLRDNLVTLEEIPNSYAEVAYNLSYKELEELYDFSEVPYKLTYTGKLQNKGWEFKMSIPVAAPLTELLKFEAIVDTFLTNKTMQILEINE